MLTFFYSFFWMMGYNTLEEWENNDGGKEGLGGLGLVFDENVEIVSFDFVV